MEQYYYLVICTITIIMTMLYVIIWKKNFGIYYSLIFTLVPILNLAYMYRSEATNLNEAILANKFTYVGGCFLSLFISLAVLDICKIKLPKWATASMYFAGTVVFVLSQTVGYLPYFYKSVKLGTDRGYSYLIPEYAPAHSLFYVVVVIYFLISIIAIVYTLFRKKNVSKKHSVILLVLQAVSIFAFFFGKTLIPGIQLICASCILSEIVLLFIMNRISMYDIAEIAMSTIAEEEEEGFATFDKKYKYLGCTGLAGRVFPEFLEAQVDYPSDRNEFLRNEVVPKLKEYDECGEVRPYFVSRGELTYQVEVHPLINKGKKIGYMLHITDDTRDREYIKLLGGFNDMLKFEVDMKTEHISQMHDNLILSMATMVESRDNSTGGHIRRTSDCVKMLTDELKKDENLDISDEFCKNLIKAAPMHDLGKIAVDDAVLKKPGRFTDEEFEKMKAHAGEGARIVHEILSSTDNEPFKVLAENVAHYHHERWDGSGYPKGLKGEEIPYEARIMAIADVYDALVSKRVYKEKMSFEKADSIIMEGMGKHFDKSLEPYYVAARPKLEEYYTELDE